MVDRHEITRQLRDIGFNHVGWGRSEVSELPNIILPGEQIYECVNGIYEGGFALLIATDIRVLDKKPLSFLTVEDMRFDMINEMDYNHRLFGADIIISSGGKNLKFRSYNKTKLRKLIGHVQHCIAESKKKQSTHQDDQVSHLEQINKQLQSYLVAQSQYQVELQKSMKSGGDDKADSVPAPPKPSNELADYLYAKSLIDEYSQAHDVDLAAEVEEPKPKLVEPVASNRSTAGMSGEDQQLDIYEEGMQEIFGSVSSSNVAITEPSTSSSIDTGFNVNPKNIAFSKLPMASRRRKFSKLPEIKPVAALLNRI
jgi:hypothetical protein